MATESTNDSHIIVPADQQKSFILTETPAGDTATFTSPTSNITAEIQGNVTAEGSKLSRSYFYFKDNGKPGNLQFNNQTASVRAKTTSGNDSISFVGNTKKSTVVTGDGSDTVTFSGKTVNSKVKLGKGDNEGDLVNVENPNQVKDLTIKHFGRNDTLVVGNKEFVGSDAEKQKFDNITIRFD